MFNALFSLVEDHYEMTQAGYILCILILIAAILLTAFLVDRKQNSQKFSARQLAFSGIALAIGFVASYAVAPLNFWGMGGSVTAFSMLFICLIGYWYGIRVGLIAAFAYSILQFIQSGGGYMLNPFQVCCDYFFAFTALGVSGFFMNKKNGLIKGYWLAIMLRGLFHTIGGYMYWMDSMPDEFPRQLAHLYSIIYNYSYILTEGVATMIFISIPVVKKAISMVTRQARADAVIAKAKHVVS